VISTKDGLLRCPWAYSDELTLRYHDDEWGVPSHDDQHLFMMLILEGQQAGLSWHGILKKMSTMRAAYNDFNPQILAAYDSEKVAELLNDPGVIRNRLKVKAAITNAQAYGHLCDRHGSLDSYLWSFVDGEPIVGNWETQDQIPSTTPLSDTISRDLKRIGFTFVGPTIVYSYLQAVGVINDHVNACSFKDINRDSLPTSETEILPTADDTAAPSGRHDSGGEKDCESLGEVVGIEYGAHFAG